MVAKYADMLAQGLLPTEVVAPMLRKLMEEQDDFDWESSLPRILSRWENETHAAEFSSVDEAFSSLGAVLWWREIEELYMACNIDGPARIRGKKRFCERAGCANQFETRTSGGNRKRFCSKKCKDVAWLARSKGVKNPRGKRRDDGRYNLASNVCKNGHERTPENTAWSIRNGKRSPMCRICSRKRNLQWYHDNKKSRAKV